MITTFSGCEYLWPFWARAEQLPPPGDWRFWLFRGGRGGGEDARWFAEAIRAAIEEGRYRRVALVAPTIAAGRQVMIEGEVGTVRRLPALVPADLRAEPASSALAKWGDGDALLC